VTVSLLNVIVKKSCYNVNLELFLVRNYVFPFFFNEDSFFVISVEQDALVIVEIIEFYNI
jgi:hypothetical protein